jgi:hypothetical protein
VAQEHIHGSRPSRAHFQTRNVLPAACHKSSRVPENRRNVRPGHDSRAHRDSRSPYRAPDPDIAYRRQIRTSRQPAPQPPQATRARRLQPTEPTPEARPWSILESLSPECKTGGPKAARYN